MLPLLWLEHGWHPESKATAGLKWNVLEVKDYIDSHYKEKLTLEGLAGMSSIHKSYLVRCFKEQLDMTVTIYINSVRVTKAKEMLRFSEETVEIIAGSGTMTVVEINSTCDKVWTGWQFMAYIVTA